MQEFIFDSQAVEYSNWMNFLKEKVEDLYGLEPDMICMIVGNSGEEIDLGKFLDVAHSQEEKPTLDTEKLLSVSSLKGDDEYTTSTLSSKIDSQVRWDRVEAEFIKTYPFAVIYPFPKTQKETN